LVTITIRFIHGHIAKNIFLKKQIVTICCGRVVCLTISGTILKYDGSFHTRIISKKQKKLNCSGALSRKFLLLLSCMAQSHAGNRYMHTMNPFGKVFVVILNDYRIDLR